MPFNRTKLPILQKILLRLFDEYGLSSQELINEINNYRNANRLNNIAISRNTLDKVKAGENSYKIRELSYIWDFLESHSLYGNLFNADNIETAKENMSPEAALAIALSRFFPEREGNAYKMRDIRRAMVGKYMTYRPFWRINQGGYALISLVEISDTADGLCITETQDFPVESPYYYYQKDQGLIFPYYKYIYFLTRELGGASTNSCVRFGVINEYIPAHDRLQSFHGVIFASSNVNIFPAVKFFCRRVDRDVKTDIIEIRNIPDLEAREYLTQPIVTKMTASNAE